MIAVVVTAAETDEAAQYLFTSFLQLTIDHVRGTPDEERRLTERSWRHAITGSANTVERRVETLIDETAADELMVMTVIHDQDARRRSFQIVGEVRDRMNARRSVKGL